MLELICMAMHRPNNDVLEGGPNNIRECAHSADSMDEAVSLSEHATQPPFINGISTRKGSLALFTPPHILTSTLPSWRERVMVWIYICVVIWLNLDAVRHGAVP